MQMASRAMLLSLIEIVGVNVMRRIRVALLCMSATILVLGMVGKAGACTVSEFAQAHLPLNSVEIPNEYRLKLVDMIVSARNWPNVDVRAIIEADAYVGEANHQVLIQRRAATLKEFMMQLGVKEENIWIDPHTLTDNMVRNEKGELGINQVAVTLVPECHGNCANFCDNPNVIPATRVVK